MFNPTMLTSRTQHNTHMLMRPMQNSLHSKDVLTVTPSPAHPAKSPYITAAAQPTGTVVIYLMHMDCFFEAAFTQSHSSSPDHRLPLSHTRMTTRKRGVGRQLSEVLLTIPRTCPTAISAWHLGIIYWHSSQPRDILIPRRLHS